MESPIYPSNMVPRNGADPGLREHPDIALVSIHMIGKMKMCRIRRHQTVCLYSYAPVVALEFGCGQEVLAGGQGVTLAHFDSSGAAIIRLQAIIQKKRTAEYKTNKGAFPQKPRVSQVPFRPFDAPDGGKIMSQACLL